VADPTGTGPLDLVLRGTAIHPASSHGGTNQAPLFARDLIACLPRVQSGANLVGAVGGAIVFVLNVERMERM